MLLLPALAAMAASPAEGADLPSLKSVTYRFEDLPSKPSGQNVSHAISTACCTRAFASRRTRRSWDRAENRIRRTITSTRK